MVPVDPWAVICGNASETSMNLKTKAPGQPFCQGAFAFFKEGEAKLLFAGVGPGHEAAFHDAHVGVPGAFENALGFVAAHGHLAEREDGRVLVLGQFTHAPSQLAQRNERFATAEPILWSGFIRITFLRLRAGLWSGSGSPLQGA